MCFDRLKKFFCATPVLRLLNIRKKILVDFDALDQVLKAILLQSNKDKLHPMVYFSKKNFPVDRNYLAHDKELLAIFKACYKWGCYLDENSTTIYTNHKPLVNLHTQPHLSRMLARWLEQLNEFSSYLCL